MWDRRREGCGGGGVCEWWGGGRGLWVLSGWGWFSDGVQQIRNAAEQGCREPNLLIHRMYTLGVSVILTTCNESTFMCHLQTLLFWIIWSALK